jgi:hypothetical protein
MSYLTWTIRRGLATGYRKDSDEWVLRGLGKEIPPQNGEKNASRRGNEDEGSNGHDRGYVGGRGELIFSQTTD